MRIKTILFPTDFSERAHKALKQAIRFSKAGGNHLMIYHAYHRPSKDEKKYHSLEEKEKDIERQFEALKKANPALEEIDHSFRKELGISTEKVIDIAASEDIDMIIMATKGANGFGELWGSKTAAIVKKVDLPVMVIPDNTTLDNVNTMALAYDYKRDIERGTLDVLVQTAEVLSADVDVVSINIVERTMSEDMMKIKKQVKSELESIPQSFSYFHNDDVEDGIMDYCHKKDIGMIGVIPHSYNFLAELFHDSLTQKMVFHSDIPLLVIK